MAQKETFYYNSSCNTTKIHAVRYLPEGNITAILQITHGMTEYIERYEDFALFLTSKGFLVTGHDHLGHGQSVNSKEEWGYFCSKEGNRVVLNDIWALTQITKEKYPKVPYFILGHSMGSFYARQYLCEFGQHVDGAIIMGTGCQPYLLVQAGRLLTSFLAVFKGWNHRSNFINALAKGNYNKRFRPNRTNKDWLSRDTRMVDKYVADECCNYIFTLNAYYNMFTGISRLYNKKLLSRIPKELPVFFVSGSDDPVGDYGKGVMKAADMLKQIGLKNITTKLYPTARHEILNETNRSEVYEDLYTWIAANLTK